MRYLFIITICFLSLFGSCRKTSSAQGKGWNGIVKWSGPVAADGCDWVIMIDSKSYHPSLLPDAFKQDNLPVKISFVKTNSTYGCGMLPASQGGGLPVIDIIKISKF